MSIRSFLTFAHLCVTIMVVVSTDPPARITCKCPELQGCYRAAKEAKSTKQAVVVSNGQSDFSTWGWNTITVVLASTGADAARTHSLGCYTHKKGKKFGFIEPVHVVDLNKTSVDKWISNVKDTRAKHNADIVAVNLVPALNEMGDNTTNIKNLELLLTSLAGDLTPKIDLSNPVEIICIVPWTPYCYQNDCDLTSNVLYHSCHWLMISAHSFEISKNLACKAQATIPATRMALGVDEYASRGIAEDRIILGIVWHGYNYSCVEFTELQEKSTCMLKQKKLEDGTTICDVEGSRQEISVGEIMAHHPEIEKRQLFSEVYKAPLYNYYNPDTHRTSQIWYEDIRSLTMKYKYAHTFGLKGVAIWTAEDMSNSSSASNMDFNGGMWNWVLHGIIQTTVKQPPPVKYHADVVAGVSIGCLLGGVALGVLFTCLALRHRVKKKPGAPFKRDTAEYHDDDDLNL